MQRLPCRVAPLAAGALIALSTPAPAQTSPTAGPLQALAGDALVAGSAGRQSEPAVAAGAGGYLAVWTDERTVRPSGSSLLAGLSGSEQDLYALRLDAAGTPLGPLPFPLTQDAGFQREPQLAWNGAHWLVAWENQTPSQSFYQDEVFAVRVAPDGTVLDDPPIAVLPFSSSFALAANGGEWAVVGQDDAGGGLVATRVAADGTVLDPGGVVLVPDTYFLYFGLDFEAAGGEYLLTYTAQGSPLARRFDASLAPIGGVVSLPGTNVASSGSQYFLNWSAGGSQLGSPMALDGTLLVPGGAVVTAASSSGVHTSWGGTQWWTAWTNVVQGAVVARTNPDGVVLDPGGAAISPAFGSGMSQAVIAGGVAGEAAALWTDRRAGGVEPEDVFGAGLSAAGQASPETSLSSAATTQTRPALAAGAGGYALAFESESSGARRILAHRLDQDGMALDPEPFELASGTNLAVSRPCVAWNGSNYLFAWSENGSILARRMLPDGTFLDPSPFAVMPGTMPAVAALGEIFLLAATDAPSNPQFRFLYAARVDGTTGAVLDSPPFFAGQYFAQLPRVTAFQDRWMIVWQRNFSHDDPHSEVAINIVFPDGTQSGELPTFIQGGLPDVAAADDMALIAFRSGSPASAYNDVRGMRIAPDGTLLDNTLFGFDIAAIPLIKQLDPRVVWTGSEFVVGWQDTRDQVAFFDLRTDVFGARVTLGAEVLDPLGFPIARAGRPQAQVSLAVPAGGGSLLAALASFDDAAPHASYRIVTSEVSGCCSPSASYCTAGTSASGCQALLAASGAPSATAVSGFLVSASGVEGQKDGLFFFGANGRQSNPWGNGTSYQCVVPPVVRGGLLAGSGTAAACDGAFGQDLNALWTARPAKNPGAGEVVQLQLWYRDPLSTSNQTTSLSNALEFTVEP